MSSMEEFIRTQNRIREQFVVPKAVSALTMNKSLYAYTSVAKQVASIHTESALLSLAKELQRYREMNEAVYKSISVVQKSLSPVLEEYHRVSEVVSVTRKIQESMHPITDCLKDIQPMLPNQKVLSQLAEIRRRIQVEPSVMIGLKEALETQINSSLWEFEGDQEEFEEPFEEEMQEDILMLTEAEDKAGFLKQFLAKWGEKGKKIIVGVVKWILLIFLGGLVEHWCEPIYRVLTPSFLLQEENADTGNKIKIPVNTEVHVWNDITNNFIEITYKIDDTEYQGYMEQGEFKANTEKISDAVELEHLLFINDVTQLLSKKWNTHPERVYSFLKDETDLLNEYLLKHYDVLMLLEEAELVENIETYCEEKGITVISSEEVNDSTLLGTE